MNDCNCSGGGLKDFSPKDFERPIKDNPILTAITLIFTGGIGFGFGMMVGKKGKK